MEEKNNSEMELLDRLKFGIVKNSNYDKLLSKIIIDTNHEPKDAFKIKNELIKRAMIYLIKIKNDIGKALDALHGGGNYQFDAAIIAIINGWRKLPDHRYLNHRWNLANAPDADDTCIQVVSDTVTLIQKQDREEACIKSKKDAETKRKRKISKALKEMGYVQMYVNPEIIEHVNDVIKNKTYEQLKFEIDDNVLVVNLNLKYRNDIYQKDSSK